MKNSTEEIDQIIKESLTKEEAQFYDDLDEQNLIQMFGGLFKTKQSWLIITMNIVNLIAFGVFVYCLVQFINTNETNELILWALAGGLCWSTMIMIKVFSWMQMDKNALLREMKRLELQIAALANKS